jgi:hypothetical protein
MSGVEVRAADAAAQDLEPHLAPGWSRLREILHGEGRVLAGDGFHGALIILSNRAA